MKSPICICVPCGTMVHTGFTFDLTRMVGYWTRRHPDQELKLISLPGTVLARQRFQIAKKALEDDAGHLLWIDSDMRFPHDALDRLLAHDKDIVLANYSTRGGILVSTACALDESELVTRPDSTGLEIALHGGFGLALIKREVFEQMNYPWFACPFDLDRDDFIGEDVFWCAQARKSGFDVWVDQDVSKEMRHCGSFEYTHEHAAQHKMYKKQFEAENAAAKMANEVGGRE